MNTDPEKSKPRNTETSINAWILTFSVAAFVLVAVGTVEWRLGHRAFFGKENPSLSDLGNYGSYLQGTVTSLWSLAGLFIIFVAFLAQKQQLLRQDVELEDQRKQFQFQQDSIKRQNFESSFFQLLGVHNQIVAGMSEFDLTTNERSFQGHACFDKWYRALKTNPWGIVIDEHNAVVKPPVESPVEKYIAFYGAYQGVLGHYFRNLYHAIKFVKNSELEDKRRYTSLVRATLSQSELTLLFYNCLSPVGQKFKPMVEEFGLLKNLDHRLLMDSEDDKLLVGLYNPKAFQ